MITATVDQRQGATTRRVRVSASSMERVLDLAGASKPDTDVWLVDETGLLDELPVPAGGAGASAPGDAALPAPANASRA